MLPREHLIQLGPDGLGDADLLALVLGTGVRGMSARHVATEVLAQLGGLRGLARLDASALVSVRGIGPARAARVGAALTLGRRSLRPDLPGHPISTPSLAAEALVPGLRGLAHEELHALYLDRRRAPLGLRSVSRGSDGYTLVDARQIYRTAVHLGAVAVILGHNHPSGDPTPSALDRQVTDSVARAGMVLGIPLLDHLVVGSASYVSLAEQGCLPSWSGEAATWTT